MKNNTPLKNSLVESYKSQQLAEIRVKASSDKLTTKETEQRFEIFFGVKPEKVNGMKAIHEGITFVRNCGGYGGAWQIERACPKCSSKQTTGGNTKEELGKILSESNEICYNCRNKETQIQLSTEDKLLEVLRDFVYEHSQND